MLDVRAGGLARDDQFVGDLLVGQAPHQQPEHLDLAWRQAGRQVAPPLDRVTGRAQNRFDGVGLEPRLARARPQLRRGLVSREGRAVRAGFGHGLVRVGGGQHLARQCHRAAGEPARIARPVEALVVLDGDRPQRGQPGRRHQHAFGEVGVQPHVLEL